MTTPDQTVNDALLPDQWRELCTQYLLSELSADEASEFEQQLADSPLRGKVLLEQANLITDLSATGGGSATTALPCPAQSRVHLTRRVVGSLVAIAACVALIISIKPPSISDESVAAKSKTNGVATSEDLLIAQAWVDNQIDIRATEVGLVDEVESEDWRANSAQQQADVDATLSWMFIAVSDGPGLLDTNESGATNDG